MARIDPYDVVFESSKVMPETKGTILRNELRDPRDILIGEVPFVRIKLHLKKATETRSSSHKELEIELYSPKNNPMPVSDIRNAEQNALESMRRMHKEISAMYDEFS